MIPQASTIRFVRNVIRSDSTAAARFPSFNPRQHGLALKQRHLPKDRAILHFGMTFAFRWVSLRTKEKTKMTTKINLNGLMENLNCRETLVRDTQNVKVKTSLRAGAMNIKRG